MMRGTIVVAAVIMAAALWRSDAPHAAGGSATRGKLAYQDCAACHGARGQGSDLASGLRNIVGRKVADENGFAYSPALRRHGGVWSEERLAAFLLRPQAEVKGNRMAYAGAASAAEAADLVAYLKTIK